ncbi:Bug family tripartite tricarboxylate transporter substrate binding protein [Paraburkholderia xenovorans]
MKSIIKKGMLCAVVALSVPAFAAYPDKPITLVIGFSAGGPTDIVGRYLAKGLASELNTSVVVQNRTGADGIVAVSSVKNAPADGYTLMLGSSSTLSIQPVYKKHPNYDVPKDFTSVGMVASYPYVLVVPASSPYTTTQDLINAAKAHPGMTFASAGNGSVNHLAGVWFGNAEKIKITHVPYAGDSAAIADLVTNRVNFAFLSIIAAMPQVKAGKLRALAVASVEPSPLVPDLPTVVTSAGIPGFAAAPWNGVLAPKGTPADVVKKLNVAINQVMSKDDARKMLAGLGQVPVTGDPSVLDKQIHDQTAHWKDIIDENHIPQVSE